MPKGDSERIKLIEVSLAGADERPLCDNSSYATPGPKAGTWFRAIRHADEVEPEPHRFAFCAFPARYDRRRPWTYIIDESNVIYMKDLRRPGGVDVFPADPEKDGWEKLE